MKRLDTIPKEKGYQLPDSDRHVPYDVYRARTGLCETCHQKVATHDKCRACGTLCGEGHLELETTKFRGRKLCSYCQGAWLKLDGILGYPASWERFTGHRYNSQFEEEEN